MYFFASITDEVTHSKNAGGFQNGVRAMFRKKQQEIKSYNKEMERPVMKCSICTGEQVAGFKDLKTGKFREVMLIRNQKDLKIYLEQYQISEEEVIKEY